MKPLPLDREHIARIPQRCGVYIFLGARSQILYVGKAVNLRARVRSYLGRSQERRLVTQSLHRHIRSFDFVVTGDEKEALLLENSMIKEHGPKYNVSLRDDKTYFSLRLNPKEKWPWFQVVRRRRRERGVLYFGPYTSALSCRKTLQFLNTLFQLRTCPDSILANRTRPCISHEIKQCVAPCVDLVTREGYLEIVDQAVMFLKGRNKELVAEVERKMMAASKRFDYESAAVQRDRLEAIRTTVDNPSVTRNAGAAFDVVGLYRSEDDVQLVVLVVRDGVLTASLSYKIPAHHDTDELLASFLGQFYSPERPVPSEVILPEDCEDMVLLEELLTDLRGASVKLVVPERGEKKKLLGVATRNAELAWMQRHRSEGKTAETLGVLEQELRLHHSPQRIECFDISNLMGTHVVGSCVAFIAGRPDKNRYRRYKIRSVEGQDDFASMAEVLRRRLSRGVREDDLPDLVVIDGGRGQLGAVHQVMKDLKIDSVDLIALAKARTAGKDPTPLQQKERVFKPDSPVPIILAQASEHMRLLVRIRDEAHRFAITYHRRLRAKSQVTSLLEMIPGIGRQKSRTLLREFGSVSGVREASDEDLVGVRGVTPQLVRVMREFFENRGNLPLDEPVEE